MGKSSEMEKLGFTPREIATYKQIKIYYDNLDIPTKDKIYDIIMSPQKTCISLRILDWFATEYSKTSGIELTDINGENIHIYISYKSQLKTYGKKYFDPFRRHIKFIFYYKNIETTIAQLNFFRWAITNNIMPYIEENIEELTKNMNASNLNKKKKKKDKNDSTLKSYDSTFTTGETLPYDDVDLTVSF
jgi:hypothetical protein